jgi:hypothetical protein
MIRHGGLVVALFSIACESPVPVVQARGVRDLPAKWNAPGWTLVAEDRSQLVGSGDRIGAALIAAARAWRVELNIERRPARPKSGEDGDNTVTLVTAREFEKVGGLPDAEARTILYTRPGARGDFAEIVEADIHIRADAVPWMSPNAGAVLELILLHELGHFLGLDHPCEASASEHAIKPACSALAGSERAAMNPRLLDVNSALSSPSEQELEWVEATYSR